MQKTNCLLLFLMAFLIVLPMSCTKHDLDSAIQDKDKWIVSKIDESSLNGWNNGYVINNHLYLCEFTDSTTSNLIGIVGDFDYADNLVITIYNGYLQTICTDSETFYFTYNETGIRVLSINKAGNVEELNQTRSYNKRATTRSDINTPSWLGQFQDFLNNYADKLSTSDSQFLRDQAKDLRNFPENLIKDGLINGLTKLTGNKFLPYIKNILDKLGEYDRERSIFGNCMMTILGISKNGTDHYINANLNGFESMPNHGEDVQSVTGGVVCRYTRVSDTWNTPTTSYYDYKWQHDYNGNSNLTEKLPEMKLGWYEFRPYVTKVGITKYGNLYSYLYKDLKESPSYSISNIKCTYLGDDKFKVEFDCSFVPLENEGLLYQGIKLNTENGDKIVSFGAGTTSERISQIISADNFKISGTTATLNIKAQYWYVTRYSSETFYKDLEDNSMVKYSVQPSLKFTSAQINGTSIIEYDEKKGNHYETKYSFEYEVTGAFWIDHIQYSIVQDNWNNYWDAETVSSDGKYSISGKSKYWTTSTNVSHQSNYTIYLKTGEIIQSSNSLFFSGNPISSVSISGNGNLSTNAKKTIKGNSFNDNELITFCEK